LLTIDGLIVKLAEFIIDEYKFFMAQNWKILGPLVVEKPQIHGECTVAITAIENRQIRLLQIELKHGLFILLVTNL